MRRQMCCLAAAGFAAGILMTACGSSGAGGRPVDITQADQGCTPTTITATPGEKLKLVVHNTSGKDYEVEGIDGTKLEEVVVPSGKIRTPGYDVPEEPGTHKIKCYVPGGVSTIIEVQAAAGSGTPAASGTATSTTRTSQAAGAVDTAGVAVTLNEYVVAPDPTTAKAGEITFSAHNASASMTHELAVLRPKADGSFENLGEVEDLAPGASGDITLDLPAGNYVLACLIVPGEAGSTTDHYQQGMHTPFTAS